MWEAKQHVQKSLSHTRNARKENKKGKFWILWDHPLPPSFFGNFVLNLQNFTFTFTIAHLSIIPSNLQCWHLSWVIVIWTERSSFHSEKTKQRTLLSDIFYLCRNRICCVVVVSRIWGAVEVWMIHFMFWCWNGWCDQCDQCGYINVLTLHSTGQSLWTKFLSINFQTVFLNVSCCRQNVLF